MEIPLLALPFPTVFFRGKRAFSIRDSGRRIRGWAFFVHAGMAKKTQPEVTHFLGCLELQPKAAAWGDIDGRR
jgi:hypothetical protein